MAAAAQAAPRAPDGVSLVKVHRHAERLKPPAVAWVPAAAGASLAADDSLRTLNNSYADLQLDPPNRFRLKENSVLKVERLFKESREPDGSVVRLTDLGLLKGEVIARLDKLPAGTRLTLRSPVAVAAVRGTGFAMSVEADGKTTGVAVAEGSVRVEALGEPDKHVTVPPDRRTTVAPWAGALLRAKGTGLPPRALLLKRLGDPAVPLKDARVLLERLSRPSAGPTGLALSGEGRAAAPAGIADPAEAEGWARAEARRRAQGELAGKLGMLMLSGNETVGDLMERDPKVSRRLLDAAVNAPVSAEGYSAAERAASVRLEFSLDAVPGITGRDLALAWRGIAPLPRADYAALFGGFIRAAAERAATVDAYRRLAERIYGTVLTSSTTLRDFAVADDRVEVAVNGLVQGAEEVAKTYYSDGSIDVTLEIGGARMKEGLASISGLSLGAQYLASPSALDADDFLRLLGLGGI
jgi:hypothetical protein